MKKGDSNRSPPATVGSEKSHQTIFGRTTQMKKETDLQKIKEYANGLLMDPVFEQPEKSSEQEDSMQMNVTATDCGAASEYDGTLCEKAGKQMDKNKVYELIEVCGRKALFTNEKLYNRDVPKGLYCYDVRTDDSGNFCTLEANVYVNYGGSVLFREPVELGKEEYIVFDEETSPNFPGDTMSADEFINAVFDEVEATDMNNRESSVNTPSEEYTEENGMGGMEL